jgi:hypothetical protein
LRRRDALTLLREWLDLDALTTNGSAFVEDQIAGGIAHLAVGDADVRVSTNDGNPLPDCQRAKLLHRMGQVINLSHQPAPAVPLGATGH